MKTPSLHRFTAFFAVFMILCAVVAGVREFSGVPHWDSWPGILGISMDIMDGKIERLFEQANEHRLILARIIFLLEVHFFGNLIFLVCLNYFFAFANAWILCAILRNGLGDDEKKSARALCFFITGCLFLWVQHENFLWEFQSQFFMAQLLPLCALYAMGLFAQGKGKGYFVLAALLGVLCAGTMANGILTLPLLIVCAIAMRFRFRNICILVVLAVIVLFLYYHHYESPPQHGKILDAFRNNFFAIVNYNLCYFGGVFYHMTGRISAAIVSGIVFSLATIFLFLMLLWKRKFGGNDVINIILAAFVLYIIASAAGTSLGRLQLGLESAFASRYTTPVILAWMAVFILYWRNTNARNAFLKTAPGFGMVILCFFFMVFQFKKAVLGDVDSWVTSRQIGAMAFAMQVKDPATASRIIWDPDYGEKFARKFVERKISIFRHFPYKDMNTGAGKYLQADHLPPCQPDPVHLKLETIPSDPDYYRISGFISESASVKNRLLRFVSEDHVAGFALQEQRYDWRKIFTRPPHPNYFFGYLSAGVRQPVIVNNSATCIYKTVPVFAPPPD